MSELILHTTSVEPSGVETGVALNGSASAARGAPPLDTQLDNGARLLREWPEGLIYDDGIPMETARHRWQMSLLLETLDLHWADRQDYYAGGNMFVYFSPDQIKTEDFRGPDFFVVLGVEKRERLGWVVWQEGKAPDVVVELLSDSTAEFDKTKKKEIYATRLRAPEYYWYDPFSGELAGFVLKDGAYQQLSPDERGRLLSPALGLAFTRWQGVFGHTDVTWLRFETLAGMLLPTQHEALLREQQQVEQERARAKREQARAKQQSKRAAQERERAEQERERAEQERERAEQERERAEQERERAEQERERAAQERERAEQLAARLRELGIDPDTVK